MKKSRKCPKCNSSEVFTDEGNIMRTENSARAISTWSRFKVATYICSACGYLEEYMSEKDLQKSAKMDKIRDKWEKV